MKLKDHLEKIRNAPNPDVLEDVMQAAFDNPSMCKDRTRSRLRRAVRERGLTFLRSHERSDLLPQFGARRRLTLCGETYNVGFGQNSTGERWVWTEAEEWARDKLLGTGMPLETVHLIWGWLGDYPHRSVAALDDYLATNPTLLEGEH